MSELAKQAKKKAEFIGRLSKEPPEGCGLQVGDMVNFTNEYGVTFVNQEVVGFSDPDKSNGRCVHLADEAYWFPISPEDITLTQRPQAAPSKPLQRPKL